MEYYHSSSIGSSDTPSHDATMTNVEPTPVNARLEARDDGRLYGVWPAGSAPHGIAFLTAFTAGELHTLRLSLKVGTATAFRLEAHGAATRMQKAVAIVHADGTILSQSEEVSRVSVKARPEDATLEITFEFVPFRSLVEWFYVFAAKTDETNDSSRPLFDAGSFHVGRRSLGLPVKCIAHVPALDIEGTLVACQNMLVLRNYVHLHLELQRPGTELIMLDLITGYPVAHAQWWTWNPPDHHPMAVPVSDGAIRLRARKPSMPVSSPALMDVLGPAFANAGHAITFMFADLFDMTKLGPGAADKIGQAQLGLHFADGSTQVIDIPGSFDRIAKGFDPWIELVFRYLVDANASAESAIFLEAGARGGASAHMRQRVSERGWHYLGIDISADANVDIVADVHSMAPNIVDASVTVVYSSEVMEHLVSPTHFVKEAHRVLVDGGLFIARAPTTWPLHAEPWDFWRFSRHAWQGLLNGGTGFEILEVTEFGEAAVVPSLPFWAGGVLMSTIAAPLLTGVVARKVSTPRHHALENTPGIAAGGYDPA